MAKNVRFLTIGNRLSKQLLSKSQYGSDYSEKGICNIEAAFGDHYYTGASEFVGYRVENITMDALDIIHGPDVVVGTMNCHGNLEKAEIAFIYDDLDTHNDLQGYKEDIYQGHIVFDKALNQETAPSSARVLREALTLLTMKLNFDAFLHDTEAELILGIHDNIITGYPLFSEMMVEFGFIEDRRNVDQQQIVLFHKGTGFNNQMR